MPLDALFRAEAANIQSQQYYGAIVLRQPWQATFLTATFVGVVGLLVAFFFLFGFTRKENVDGIVLPDRGLISLAAPSTGVVTESRAVEGGQVKAGDVLFVLSGERSTRHGETQETINRTLEDRIQSLSAELAWVHALGAQKAESLARRRANILAQMRDLQAQIALQEERSRLTEEILHRYELLQSSGFVSSIQLRERSAALLEQKQTLQELLRKRESVRLDLETVDSESASSPLETDRQAASLKRAVDEAEHGLAASEANRQVLVRASSAGVISSVGVQIGQPVREGQPLAALQPAGSRLQAVFYAPSRAIGLVRPGTPVELRFDAYPYEKYGLFHGTVREVSKSPALATELPASPGQAGADRSRYRIRVSIEAGGRLSEIQLKPGMRVRAALLLEHRKLYEWAFRPLLKLAAG